MICRLWRGWASLMDAEAYERIVRTEVIPGIEAMAIAGFRAIDLMRRPCADGERIEFMTLMWFDRLEDIRAFTGEDYEVAHVPAPACAVLAHYDRRAAHFEVLERRPQAAGRAPRAPLAALPANAALLVVDVQMGFLDPDWGERNNPDAEANIARLIAAWRASGRPIHHVHHASPSPTGHFRPGSPGHRPRPEALAAAGEPIHVKAVNSAFIGTTLEADLRAAEIDTLVIVGLTTNHCVSTTARMAGNLGFVTYVVEDATATFDRLGLDGRLRSAADVHAAALSDLADEFATIVATEAVLRAAGAGGRGARLVARLRGRGDIDMTTDEITALTLGEP